MTERRANQVHRVRNRLSGIILCAAAAGMLQLPESASEAADYTLTLSETGTVELPLGCQRSGDVLLRIAAQSQAQGYWSVWTAGEPLVSIGSHKAFHHLSSFIGQDAGQVVAEWPLMQDASFESFRLTADLTDGATLTASIVVYFDPMSPDLNGDGAVDSHDLLALLGAWETGCADLTGDGMTDADDLLMLLANWTGR